MSAPELEGGAGGDLLELLAAAARLPDEAERKDAAQALVSGAVFEGADRWTLRRARDEVRRLGLMSAGDCDALVSAAGARRRQRQQRERQEAAAAQAAEAEAEGEHQAPGPRARPAPEGALGLEGMPTIAYVPGDGSPRGEGAATGEVFELVKSHWRRLLSWAPAVLRVLEAPNERGDVTGRFYEVRAGGRSVLVSHDELLAGEPWKVLPVSAGSGARRVREVLVNIVLAEAEGRTPSPAISRTGWHAGEDGKPFYVFADGRTSDGREVLIASQYRDALAMPARPVPPVSASVIAAHVRDIREHGRAPALAAMGLAARGFGHSFHAVQGGAAFVGPKYAGKTNAAWHGRTMSFARQHRAGAYPPVPSGPFTATVPNLEGMLDFEADTLGLLEDLPLHPGSTRAARAEAEAKLDQIFRSLFNATPIKPRASITLAPRPNRYVRSPVVVTAQEIQVQPSLLNRFLRLPVRNGDVDVAWYRGPDETAAHSAALVPSLRTLAEAHVIPLLAQQGEHAAEYLAAQDAAGMRLLAPELAARVPGWESSDTGIARVAGIAAAVLGGALIIAEVLGLAPAELTGCLVPYLADSLAAQAAELGDMAAAEAPAEELGEIVRAAWLDMRAHVCDDQGVPFPAIEGLSEQEQGLELMPGAHEAAVRYRGRGVPFYWLPELGALGVQSTSLHKLLKAADAGLVRGRPADALPGRLLAEGLALPSGQQTKGARQAKIGGRKLRIVLLRPEIFISDSTENDAAEGGTGGTGGTAQVEGIESNTTPAEGLAEGGTAQVRGRIEVPAAAGARCSDSAPEQAGTTGTTLPASGVVPGEAPPGAHRCSVCDRVLDRVLVELGDTTHPGCAPGPALSAGELAARGFPPELAEAAPAEAAPAAAPARATSSAAARPRAEAAGGHAFVVLGGDGRAYLPDGEVCEVAPGRLEAVRNAGELAALGLELGTGRGDRRGVLYCPAPVREALRLPAEVEALPPGEGVPHGFIEAADPAAWDVRPGGLAAWLNVFRVPATLREGIDLAFPEWLAPVRGDAPQLGELTPPELAAALTHVWRATTYQGGPLGGVHFRRSAPATMRRLLEASTRRARRGRPEARAMPRPLTPEGRKARMAPLIPGPHAAPVAEVPAGWILAHLDVRSCFLSAPLGTWFAVGEYEHVRPGRLGARVSEDMPGLHLVRAPAAAAVIHPGLAPWFPRPARRAAEVSAHLDTVAVRWLLDQGMPLEVLESYVSPDRQRVFDSPLKRLGDARAHLKAKAGRPEAAAAGIVTAMYQHTLGGWLASDFAGNRDAGDWLWAPDWWVTTRTQAEVRKQRNLLPALEAGALVLLAHTAIDTVYAAAPSREALEAAPGAGGRPLIREGRGGFALEAATEITPALAGTLARAAAADRLAAIRDALGEGKQDRK